MNVVCFVQYVYVYVYAYMYYVLYSGTELNLFIFLNK